MAETEKVLNEVRKTVDDVIAQIKAGKLHIYFNWSRDLLIKAIFTCPTKWDMPCGRGD